MRYKLFGSSGLRVSELALGTMTFGQTWNWGASSDESSRMLDVFLDRGGNFVDTANVYTNGESEQFLGDALKGRRGNVVLSTKFTLARAEGNVNAAGSHRKNLVESLEESLKRLQTDYIDIYWVHAHDMCTPAEETMRALDDAVRSGKILYLGISDAPAWWVSRANMLAELRGWTAFVGLQLQYNLIERTVERELIPMAEELDLAICAWSPLAGGALTGKYLENRKDESRAARYDVIGLGDLLKVNEDRSIKIAEELVRIGQEIDLKPHQVALAWIRQRPYRTPVIPIIGARSVSQLEDNLAILDHYLPADAVAKLDTLSALPTGFPHDFLAGVRSVVYGDLADRIHNHRAG
ncbi:MAG: aldo/keto reductase [Dinoroseobacter sp.]|nr:aldo/keto reductase [Dinoroseobacter sp.]